MIFREQTYSVLIASSDEKLNMALKDALAPGEYWPVLIAWNGGEARRIAAGREFDLILVNDPLKDGSAAELALELAESSRAAVAVLARRDLADGLYFRTVEHGVFVLAKPMPRTALLQDLRLLCAARERLRKSEEKQLSVESRMAQIRLVNRAKWLLIDRKGLSEAEAHRYIEKMAMDTRRSKEAVAEEIIHLDRSVKKE